MKIIKLASYSIFFILAICIIYYQYKSIEYSELSTVVIYLLLLISPLATLSFQGITALMHNFGYSTSLLNEKWCETLIVLLLLFLGYFTWFKMVPKIVYCLKKKK